MPTQYAAVFPGQGSQSIGMLKALSETTPIIRQTFEEAGSALGIDLWGLTQEGPDAVLNATENTQPVMLAAGVAVWRAWQARCGTPPAIMAGHSLGEYSALVCADALEFTDAVKLVAERGRRMQAATPEGQGAMAALLGLSDELVQQACAEAAQGQVVAAVNFNSPGQVVIAGETAAVERAMAAAQALGAKRAVRLPVSVPSHCALMRPAAELFRESLAMLEIRTPSVPVIHNFDTAVHPEPGAIRVALESQLYQPVRWVETVQGMVRSGVTHIIEFGPGKVLAGLTKRIDKQLDAVCIHDPASLEAALAVCGGD
ncbi:MAG: ACP S-malonyltransferase [Thiotrichales bacterium]